MLKIYCLKFKIFSEFFFIKLLNLFNKGVKNYISIIDQKNKSVLDLKKYRYFTLFYFRSIFEMLFFTPSVVLIEFTFRNHSS